MRLKTGEAVAALHHPAVGDIDLIWGRVGDKSETGYGLAKIAARHPEVLSDLQGFIDGLSVRDRNPNSVILESPGGEAVVRLNWMGKAKRWLLTAFQKNDPSSPGKRIDASVDPVGPVGRQALPPQVGSRGIIPPSDTPVNENPPPALSTGTKPAGGGTDLYGNLFFSVYTHDGHDAIQLY